MYIKEANISSLFGYLLSPHNKHTRMEKSRIEVSTSPALSPVLSLAFCAVCGLVCNSQIPVFAVENTEQLLRPATIRPAATGKTTTAKSSAKSQVAKARTSPLQALDPKSKAVRFALTHLKPKAKALPLPAQQEISDEVIARPNAVVAMRIATPSQNAAAEEVAVVSTVAANEDDTDEIEAANPATAGESEPLTGTIILPSGVPGPLPNAPAAEGSTASEEAVTVDSRLEQSSRLTAPRIAYENGAIIAEGTPEEPVRFEGATTRIIAQKVRLDTIAQTVRAEGTVRVEREIQASRFSTFSREEAGGGRETETITETLQGENFEYNYQTRQGKLDTTNVRLANFNISAESIIINGTKYIASNVIIRPGGLTEREIKIYGTPPLSIHAKRFEADTSKAAPTNNTTSDTSDDIQPDEETTARTRVSGAALYFKNFRLFPIPSSLLSRNIGGPREQETYQLTPRIAFNSANGLLVTVGLRFPFSAENPERLTLKTDIGLSTRVGFRGGATLVTKNNLGQFSVGARINDVISSQLTNRIELDRLPELGYDAPKIPLFTLPGGRLAGLKFEARAGDYRETFTNGNRTTEGSRLQGQLRFTTRMGNNAGPYLDLVGRSARYSNDSKKLTTAGFEVGYVGSIGSRISGQFSFGATKVNGSTPFEFDKVPIRRELRTTFDILLTPRYIIPIDLRYDLDRKELREKSFGLLRNYKTFAYGLTYQASRQELQLEIRQGF